MVPIPGLFARVVAYWAYPVLSGHVMDWPRRTRTHCRRSWEIVTTFPRCPGDAAQSRSLRLNLATGSPRRSWACWYPNQDRLRTCMSVRTFCCDQLYIKIFSKKIRTIDTTTNPISDKRYNWRQTS